jgi:hypothetical protein
VERGVEVHSGLIVEGDEVLWDETVRSRDLDLGVKRVGVFPGFRGVNPIDCGVDRAAGRGVEVEVVVVGRDSRAYLSSFPRERETRVLAAEAGLDPRVRGDDRLGLGDRF